MKKNTPDGVKKIALLAGVSIGTVDRVLHNRGRVSLATQQKVNEIIKQINYKPNILARSLATSKKRTVAILIPEPKEDAYWEQVYDGAMDSLAKCEQFSILIKMYFFNNRNSFDAAAGEILKSRPDGLIMAPIFLEEGMSLFNECNSASIPVIMFNTSIPFTQPLSFIGTDSFQSGMAAAELLNLTASDKGIFAILHFDEELKNAPHMLEKERGFLTYLKKECKGREYISVTMNNQRQYYYSQIQRMFEQNQISGIFVSTSKAHRIGSYLQKENIKGVRLVGYDLVPKNIDLMKAGIIDFLINQNPKRQVQQSINSVRNYLLYKENIDQKKLFPIEIIIKSNLSTYLDPEI